MWVGSLIQLVSWRTCGDLAEVAVDDHAALTALQTAFSRKLASADDAAKDLLAEEATRAGVYISVVLKCSRECVDLLNVLQWTMLSTLDYR